MESIIIFSGGSLTCFLFLALFSNNMNLSLPQNRVLRSLGRTISPKDKENTTATKTSSKESSPHLLYALLHLLVRKDKEVKEKNEQLEAAGLKNWTSAEWKVLVNVAAFGLAFLGFTIGLLSSFPFLARVQTMLIGFIAGHLLPGYWLKAKVKKRKEEILRTLPEILDLIMVSVEAGLGFDAAMMKVVEKQKGVLADEFTIVLQDIKMGRPRRDALRDMARKNNVEDLSNVIASLVQADQLGISMGSVLRNQSNQIRQKRKQRAQEQAQKAPVKIMIPLVFFIFPSIFIIILGPAFIQIMEYFSN